MSNRSPLLLKDASRFPSKDVWTAAADSSRSNGEAVVIPLNPTRKKVVLITLYDMICLGTRILGSIVEQAGLEPHLVLLKKESQSFLVKRKDQFKNYQYIYNGLLRGSYYAVDPVTEKEVELLVRLLKKISPALIGISTRSFSYEVCKKIFPVVRRELPQIPIVAGGWGPTLEPEKFLEFSDFVCFGEGEHTMAAICRSISKNRDFTDAPNLVYHRRGRLTRNPVDRAISVEELNKVPFPDFKVANKYLIAGNRVSPGKDFYNHRAYDVFAARGCPFNCTYCLSGKYATIYKTHSGKSCPKYRLRDIDVVFEEMRQAKERGAEFIRIKDEVFPIRKKWVDAFLERYPREIGLPFFGYLRPEFHDEDTIRALKAAGLIITVVAVQSGCREIRRKIYKRTLSEEKVLAFAILLKELGIDFHYHFIYRNPFEKANHLDESLEFTYRLPYGNAMIFKLEPFPDSPIKKMIETHKPEPLPPALSDWYAVLHSMSLKSRLLRRCARLIHRHRLMQRMSFAFLVLFIPSLLREGYTLLENRFFVKMHFRYGRIKKADGSRRAHGHGNG